MNIGFDASRAFINNRTGTENYSYQLLKHLIQIDQTNRYYIYTRPKNSSEKLRKTQTTGGSDNQNSGVSDSLIFSDDSGSPSFSESFRTTTIPFPRLWTQAGLALQTFKDPLDILFVPSHTLPLIRKPGLKTVVTVHDLGAEYLPQTHHLKQRLYLKLMTDYQLKSATHLIAVSEATKKDLISKAGIPAEKITVVYEGYNKQLFKPPHSDKVKHTLKYYDLEPKTYFLFVGTIQPRKNLIRLLTAYSKQRLAGCRLPQLALAGSKGWLSEEIYALPHKLDIENQVKFLGYVPDEDLPALYNGASAFVFPSLFEGFGLPVLEAFSCGCPVLTSTTSSLPEVAGEAAVLVDPSSVEAISKGLNQLITDGQLRKRLTAQGFKQVKKFSWEKAARETLQVLERR